MIGTLYKTYPTDSFMSSSEVLIIRIVSTSISYITPPIVSFPDMIFTISDPPIIKIGSPFSLTDTDMLTIVFSLVLLPSGTAADPNVMHLQSTSTNPPTLVVASSDNSKIGAYTVAIRAKFNCRLPYYVESNQFTIRIQGLCNKNVVTGPNITNQIYQVGSP